MRAARTLLALALVAALQAAAETNPLARATAASPLLLNGRWNGVDLERRTACTSAQNNGDHGTYAQFDLVVDAVGNFTITQSGITGLNCTYSGRYTPGDRGLAMAGSLGCNDGKQGTYASTRMVSTGTALEVVLAIQLTGAESCRIDAILGMVRLPG